jgi:long-chain fatty acid transport protein
MSAGQTRAGEHAAWGEVASRLAGLLLASAAFAFARPARGAGEYFSDRGVRPIGRGGAFVAGADDLGAIWYNPAGLADAGTTILVDASWLHFTSDYTRQTQVLDANNVPHTFQFPTTHGSTPVIPIPTIAGSYNFGNEKQWTVALGALAPYVPIASYPADAPSRYSLVSLDGSALIVLGTWVAYKPVEEFRIGLGFELLTGTFSSSTVFNVNPNDRLIGAPEDPKYDALGQLNVGPIFSPSANGGIIYIPEKHVRIGVSGQLPHLIDSPATLQVRLPNAVEFDTAQQVGQNAHVQFELPAIARIGVEARPIEPLRIEVTYVREFWTTHHSIDIRPDNIAITGITGFPSPFAVSPISIPRNFDNSNSYRLGGEYTLALGSYQLDLRVGINYETSAIPNAYLSPLTIDLNKTLLGFGGGLHIGQHWRLDGVYAHVFASDTTVSPAEAAVPRINPVKGNPTATEAINGGIYSARADVLGIGVVYKF